MFTVITPFYPRRAEEAGVSLTIVGIIFSLNPIGQLFACLPTGHYLKQIGRRRGIVLSLCMMSVFILLLGAVDFCDYTWFIILSAVSRLFSGAAAGVTMTILTAIISSNFADQLRTAIMYMEFSAGLGLVSGPVIGSAFFYLGGYFLPFLVFGVYFAVCAPVVYWLLGPDRDYIEKNLGLHAGELFKHRSIALDLLSIALQMFGIGMQSPILVLHMMSYGISNEVAALLTISWTVTYTFASLIVSRLPRSIDSKTTMSIGLLVFPIAYCCMGPNFPFPSELGWIVVGTTLGGISVALVFIPCLPSMIKTSIEELGYENDDRLTDSLSGALKFCAALGEIVGPVIGGAFYTILGPKIGFGIVSVIGLCYFCVYSCAAYSRSQCSLPEKSKNHSALELIYTLIPNDDTDK